jgi:hypothetical protein
MVRDNLPLSDLHTDAPSTVLPCVVVSAVCTLGLEACAAGFDDPNGTLVAEHSYCSVELVLMLLLGYTASNVFEGDRPLDSMVLHGVKTAPGHVDVGFLSIFEHYGYLTVAPALKLPTEDTWVVLNESHFSLAARTGAPIGSIAGLFGPVPLEVSYYDQMLGQPGPITLKLVPDAGCAEGEDAPYMDKLLRTICPGVGVVWHGHEPLL